MAIKSLDFLWNNLKAEGTHYFYHSFNQGKASIPAFLEDYAYLIAALIQLQEITGNPDYLLKARELTEWNLKHFQDPESGYFYFTHRDQEDVIIRKVEIYDGAVPSGNAIMAANLLSLSIIFDLQEWKRMAWRACKGVLDRVLQYPGSFGIWATQVQALAYGMNEIVITGKKPERLIRDFLNHFIPFRVFQSATIKNTQFPLLQDKPVLDQSLIFSCRDYSCQIPVTEVDQLIPLLETVQKF
jgi:uncharacterized protein YyaL (SSP411 family)